MEKLCRRIIVIDKGQMLFDGSLEKLKNIYGKTRTMILELAHSPRNLNSLSDTAVVKSKGNKLEIEFDGDQLSTTRLITEIAAHNEVRDLVIQEQEIGTIVKSLYPTRTHRCMSYMGRFVGIVKVTFQEGLTYRIQFLADVSASCVYLLSFYYLWQAIYAGKAEIEGISLASMVAYTLVSTIIGFIVRQDVNVMIGDKVYEGDIAVELTKPISYQLVVLYTAVGQAVFNLLFKGVPVFILFGYVLDISVPFDPTRLLLAVLSCVLGFVTYFLIDLSLGSVAFWIMQTYGVNMFKNVFMAFCAGGICHWIFIPRSCGTCWPSCRSRDVFIPRSPSVSG